MSELSHGVDQFVRLAVDEEGTLYGFGEGKLLRREGERWRLLGAYAPTLNWDEAEGISAEGPFPGAILDAVSREATLALASELEAMEGDAPPEEVAELILEAFLEESSPQPTSPFAIMTARPGRGAEAPRLWLSTGSGLFTLDREDRLRFHSTRAAGLSPFGSVGRLFGGGRGARGGLSGTLNAGRVLVTQAPEKQIPIPSMGGRFLLQGERLQWEESAAAPRSLQLPGSPTFVEQGEEDQLWLVIDKQIYLAERDTLHPRCEMLSASPQGFRWSGGRLLSWNARRLWVHQIIGERCEQITLLAPQGSGRIHDLAFTAEGLWVSTSGGLFRWTRASRGNRSAARLIRAERALAAQISFPILYRATLRAQGLDRASRGYGLRPIISMFLPELQLRAATRPLRSDRRPTLFGGNQQLQLRQPLPEVTLFARWTISFDALAGLFGIEGARQEEGEQLEAQLQTLGMSQGDEGLLNFGDFDTLGADETLAIRSQRISQTLLALERRQATRERRRLHKLLFRLHREQSRLLWRRWMSSPRSPQRLVRWLLRLQEIDAIFLAYHGSELPRQRSDLP